MRLSDMNLLFRKGYFELNFDYKKVDEPSDQAACDKFMKMMRDGPDSMAETAKNMLGGKSVTDYLQTKREEMEVDMEKHK